MANGYGERLGRKHDVAVSARPLPPGTVRAASPQPAVECPLSKRVDGQIHSWRFDGDDPYIVCVYCDQMQDSLTGRVIREGNR